MMPRMCRVIANGVHGVCTPNQTNSSDGDCKEQLARHWCLVHRHGADLCKRGRSRFELSDIFVGASSQ